jgi:hypothetical protein
MGGITFDQIEQNLNQDIISLENNWWDIRLKG